MPIITSLASAHVKFEKFRRVRKFVQMKLSLDWCAFMPRSYVNTTHIYDVGLRTLLSIESCERCLSFQLPKCEIIFSCGSIPYQ
jgi:hypothetical protein